MTAAAREPKPAVSDELRAEMQAKAKAAVATWPPLTADQLAELRRVLGPEFAQNSPARGHGGVPRRVSNRNTA